MKYIGVEHYQFSRWVMSDSLWPHELQHARLPCPSPTPGTCSNSYPSSQWCHSTISSSVIPFSFCLQSFPANRVFSNESVFCIRWPKYWSFSISLINIQDWFPLGLTDLISLQSKGLKNLLQDHSSKASILYGPTLISIHNYWKKHIFDYMNICQQNDVSAF